MGEWGGRERKGTGRERESEMKETDTALWAEWDRVHDGLVRRH